jgi:serine/threonine-protein phosphatase 2B regulatory subunit
MPALPGPDSTEDSSFGNSFSRSSPAGIDSQPPKMRLGDFATLPSSPVGRGRIPWMEDNAMAKMPNMPLHIKGLPGILDSDVLQAFKEIDFDHNGFVGASELRYLLMLQGERPTDAELDEMLRMAGCGENGQASYDDFREMLIGDGPVPAEMARIVKEKTQEHEAAVAAAKALENAEDAGPPPPTKHQMDLLVKTSAAVIHKWMRDSKNISQDAGERISLPSFQARHKKEDKAPMPPVHDKRKGARRARPTEEAPPLALSPAAARNARRVVEKQYAGTIGGGGGLPRRG